MELNIKSKKIEKKFLKDSAVSKRVKNTGLEQNPFSEILKSTLQTSSCLVKKECIGSTRFPEELEVGEDVYFWLSLARKGCRFKCNPKIHTLIRRHPDNTWFRTGYNRLHVSYLDKLLSSGMLNKREDLFICHSRSFKRETKFNRYKRIRHLAWMLKSPDLLTKYLVIWTIDWLKKRKQNGEIQDLLNHID